MLSQLQPVEGARHAKKRLGRGTGSGHGKTAGRGTKGQNSRSGGGVRPGFEGGQIPLFQRLSKRGFNNFSRKEYAIVNVETLNNLEDGVVVTPELLLEKRIIGNILCGLKVLGQGKLSKKLTVKAHKFSKSAIESIENAGGTAEVISFAK